MIDRRADLLPVRNQGRRDTCVAFAVTAGHELLDGSNVQLSVEFLYWGAKKYDRLPPGTNPTTLSAAGAALAVLGQSDETLWPYDDRRDPWAATYKPPDDAVKAALSRRQTTGRSLSTPTSVEIRSALERNEVVVLGVRLFSTWHFLGASALIETPKPGSAELGGHAVLVAGYDDRIAPSDGLFVIRNSWGREWGQDGYGYLSYAYVDAHALSAWIVGP